MQRKRSWQMIGVAAILASIAGVLSPASAHAGTTYTVDMTFAEPAHVNVVERCPLFPDAGFCGAGLVLPFGQATETIAFGAGCGGDCDLRTITLPQGSILLEEHATGTCQTGCRPGTMERVFATLDDQIIGGTGGFDGATGQLSGEVRGAVSNVRPAGTSTIRLHGEITLAT